MPSKKKTARKPSRHTHIPEGPGATMDDATLMDTCGQALIALLRDVAKLPERYQPTEQTWIVLANIADATIARAHNLKHEV